MIDLAPSTRVLVTGATGAQGGATARALLAAGFRVRVLARQPESTKALAKAGAELAQGDMDVPASLALAMADLDGVFSVQVPDQAGTDSERRHGFALIKAARTAGVRQFVHASVCESGRHPGFPDWGTGRWTEKCWTDKWDIEEAVRAANFTHSPRHACSSSQPRTLAHSRRRRSPIQSASTTATSTSPPKRLPWMKSRPRWPG